MASDNNVVDKFCSICTRVKMDHDLYISLVEADPRTLKLYFGTAPKLFSDLNRILIEYLIVQFCKLTDPTKTSKSYNQTTNYILYEIQWPDHIRQELQKINKRLMEFRNYVKPARNKIVVHIDLETQMATLQNIGKFPQGADRIFFEDLQAFVDIAYGHFHNGEPCPISPAMSTDTDKLVKALEKSLVFDGCAKCQPGERAVAIRSYRGKP